MPSFLDTPIEYLKGVGPTRAKLLRSELEIATYEELLLHFPMRYVDRSTITTVATLNTGMPYAVLKGHISNITQTTTGRMVRLNALFTDATGSMELAWFQGVRWIKETLKPNVEYLVIGKPSLFNGHFTMTHPELEPVSQSDLYPNHPYQPIYPSTEKLKAKGLNSKGIAKLIEQLLVQAAERIPETLPTYIIDRYRLPLRGPAFHQIHFPPDGHSITAAIQRFKFEELFFLQLDYQYTKQERRLLSRGHVFATVGPLFTRFYKEKLPFSLTNAQKRVVKEIRADMGSGHQMNRLLQGDVGSGKTLVALLCMLLALDNGCQACLMAPTEILAQQHHATISRMLQGLGVQVELLTGSLKPKEKRMVKERLSTGDIHILIGTHALIEDDVLFQKLGLVIIDEQHRFGVKQRSRLWVKNTLQPHILVMTATPIPRTLAMTLYGDLDCSIIDELPPGRQPVQTIHCREGQRRRVFGFMKQQIDAGRQVYIVYPLIEESEKSDLQSLMEGYNTVADYFPLPEYRIGILHGRMDPDVKEFEMQRFKKGETHILVSTTVIEVGVDVPNATVMMIENAERFGLSQLHQLRGRVGRGSDKSYCILMTKNDLQHTAAERIHTMVSTNDGFRLAEVDLKLRGPGDLQGLQQSGLLNLHIADIVNDDNIVRAARDTVQEILTADPMLQHPSHVTLLSYITHKQNLPRWDRIS